MLSNEGIRILTRLAILVVVILVTAFFRTLVGPNPRRQNRLMVGTLVGLAGGVAVSNPVSAAVGQDVSRLTSIAGVIVGWIVAYQFIKRLPRGVGQ